MLVCQNGQTGYLGIKLYVMKKLLIVQNSHEGAGILNTLIRENNIVHDTIKLDNGDSFPSPRNYAALVVLGGPDSANDTTPKMQQELLRIKKAVDLQIPYLGICLGLQTLVRAAGGHVIKSSMPEIGFRDANDELFKVSLTDEGERDPLFKDLQGTFPVFQLHGETVTLTEEMTLLGKGTFCTNQVVRVRPNMYGIQCHFELTPEMFQEWLDTDLKKLDRTALLNDLVRLEKAYERTGRTLFGNFLRIAGLL
jgi:GMP synthase (glutamine-hydrolysing)